MRRIYDAVSLLFAAVALALALHEKAHGVPILSLGIATCVMWAFLSVANRVPLRYMNLPVAVTDENRARIEPVVRLHLAAIGTITVALLTWMEVAIAIGAMTVYLWTCGLFIAGIFVTLAMMLMQVGRAA